MVGSSNIIRIVAVATLIAACDNRAQNESKAEPVAEQQQPTAIRNERPSLKIMLTDGRQLDLRNLSEDFVLVLFNPECDHCHDEARQIKSRLEAFAKYNLYFVSSENMEMIDQFAKQVELEKQPNVFFGNGASQSVYDNFGPIPTPSVYIYKKDGQRVQDFEGQVDVEVIIKYL